MKLFVDNALRLEGPTTWLLQPFFGRTDEDKREIFAGIFDRYTSLSGELFEIAHDAALSDCVVVPHNWADYGPDGQSRVKSAIAEYRKQRRPVVLFYPSESCESVDWPPGVLVFRYDLLKSRAAPCEFSHPVWCSDFRATHPDLDFSPRSYSSRPSIGFCGYAPPLALPWSKAKVRSGLRYLLYRMGLLEQLRGTKGHAPRLRAILELRKSARVETRFILRHFFAYGGQWGQLRPGGTFESAKRYRLEYVQNMLDADYSLSCRGVTNTSIRCYEALSCGRIPLFVDTECRLPGDFAFDWGQIMCWVGENELPRIGLRLASFHEGLDSERFVAMQAGCRRAFEEWITPEGFFSKLQVHLEEGKRRGLFNC